MFEIDGSNVSEEVLLLPVATNDKTKRMKKYFIFYFTLPNCCHYRPEEELIIVKSFAAPFIPKCNLHLKPR